jgi:hypothetical protein
LRTLVLIALVILLPGCLARTAVGVVTLPVRAVGAVGDAVTTSQAEADRNRGRRMRKEEARQRREERRRARDEQARDAGDRAFGGGPLSGDFTTDF